MGYIDEARKELQKWYDTIDVETFTTQYESLKVLENKENISVTYVSMYMKISLGCCILSPMMNISIPY